MKRIEYKYKKMYNQEFKERFLNQYYNSEDSRSVVANYFYVSELTESLLDKDLFDMNEDEIASVMKSLNLKTILSVKSVGSYIKNYITWAIGKGERATTINPLSNVDDDWYRKLVNNSDASYWTKEFVTEDVLGNIIDFQDKVFIMLLFGGVYGKELSEIRYLKWSDIDTETNIATVYDEEGTKGRKVKLNQEIIDMLRNAKDSDVYTNIYGKKFELNETGYLFRRTTKGKANKTENEPMKRIQLLNRLMRIQEALEIPRFKPNNIYRSGMLYDYYRLLLNKNNGKLNFNNPELIQDLTNKEIEQTIAKKYDWSLLTSTDGYKFYNTSQYKRSFLNIENVLKLYKLQENDLGIYDELKYWSESYDQSVSTKKFRARHIDFVKNEERNKEVGKKGEEFILEKIKSDLMSNGNVEVEIIHTSVEKGDGAGYDIEVRKSNEEILYIEVKTTTGDKDTSFFITSNEIEFAMKHQESYVLYRVYNFDLKTNYGEFYTIEGNIIDKVEFQPLQYIARTKNIIK